MRPKLIRLLGWYNSKTHAGFIKNENINAGFIELINGVKIYLKGAENDDALRGEGNRLVVLDEYASMAPHVWPEILEPTLMDVEGDALFIGTPKGKNHFYRLFINALTHPEPYWNDWEAFHFKTTDNPFVKAKEVARLISRKKTDDGLDPRDRNKLRLTLFPVDQRSLDRIISQSYPGFPIAMRDSILRSISPDSERAKETPY